MNTLTRIVVWVPDDAQYETGFSRWVRGIARLTRQLGCRVIFHAPAAVQPLIRGVLYSENLGVRCEFATAESQDDFVLLANKILDDDLLVVVGARANSVSYRQRWPNCLVSCSVIFPATTSWSYFPNSSARARLWSLSPTRCRPIGHFGLAGAARYPVAHASLVAPHERSRRPIASRRFSQWHFVEYSPYICKSLEQLLSLNEYPETYSPVGRCLDSVSEQWRCDR